MNRWLLFLAALLTAAIMGASGYLGFRSARQREDAPPRAPVTVAVTRGDVQQTVTAPGQLVGTREMVLSLQVSGRLAEVTVRPGSIVMAGDVLARLDAKPFQEALAIAQTQLAQARAEYERRLAEARLAVENNEARVGSAQARFPSLTEAEVQLQAAIDAEARAQAEYDKALDRHWEPADVVEGYRLALVQATRQRQVAQAAYDAVLNQRWAVGQEVAALETEVEQASLAETYLQEQGVDPLLRLAVKQAEADLAAAVLVAPFDGVVLEVMVRPGETVSPATNLIVLADPAAVEVRTTVIEEDMALVQIGQAAELFFDAQPDVAVQGQVARIVPQRVSGEARPLYHVYVNIDDAPAGVFPGMTADAAIVVARQNNVLRLPRALVLAKSDGTATVEVWQNGQRHERDVKVGLRGDVYVEIVAGLQLGDEVVGE